MSIINTGTGEQSPEPFRMWAATYLDIGLSIFPCLEEEGKKPCTRWKALQKKRIGSKTLDKWVASFPNANIGIVTGKLSGITVIDSDNPATTLPELFSKYGETPLVASTPSGGYHLYYRYNSENCSQDTAQRIDVRGEGGFIIAPPSFNRTTGAMYYFIEGDISEFSNLPFIKNNSEIQREYSEGERNNALFKYLLTQAKSCYNLSALQSIAEEFNQEYLIPPLDIAEIQRTVKSVWGYKEKGTLPGAGEQFITLPMHKLKPVIFEHPKAFALYADLISCHYEKNKTFAISPKAYAKRCGWTAKTVRQEIQTLLLYGLIKRVYEGGKHAHDPSSYKFI